MNEPVPADARTTVSAHEPVAVIGLACRLPGAKGPADYWTLLTEGRSAIGDAPEDRRTGAPHDDAFTTARGTTIPYRGGFIDAPADFDAAFFGISPREAEAMDPQARLVLELGWEALENAALPVARLPRATGVFVGADVSDYAELVHRQGPDGVGHHTLTGLNRGLIANRLSYALGAGGPSLTVDSAQSSSLVAVQLACDSLRGGDCDVALAGGVHLNLVPGSTLALAEFGGLSPDGLCHTFDARANGFVRGEGAGVVVLKPLSRALADGDHVHAVIRGGAVNNDGTGAGLTSPDAAAQEAVLRSACDRAGVAPASIDYVELHGTGTRVGDPVEATALGAALGTDPGRTAPLAVGSVKTNIGHLEGAAGIAGLLKVILCLSHGRLVPSLNHTTPNPAIDLDALGLHVQLESTEWTAQDPGRPLRAGVSSFGMGGTNAHLVLEQAPPRSPAATGHPAATGQSTDAEGLTDTGRPAVPWLLSARSPEALHAQTERLAAHPAAHADPLDVGWSLLTTRTPFEYRAVGAAADTTAILRHLQAAVPPGLSAASLDRPVFVFPGQGSQWAGMAAELIATAPAFADSIAACEAALAPHVDWSLSAVLRGDAGAPTLDRSEVEVVQPVLWAVMVSLAALWRAHGVEPAAVVGHSQGEIAAACVAGALSLEDGALAVALRSKALVALKGLSGMMSVALPEPQARTLIAAWDGRVAVAAVNGPSSVVVSGDTTALDELTAEAERQDIRVRRIDVDYASHSAHVEAVEDEVLRLLAPITPRTPEVPFLSTVTGDWLREARTDAAYWYANLRRPVLLEPAVRALAAAGHSVFIEVSPHPVLTVPVRETAEAATGHADHTVVTGTLRRGDGGLTRFYTSLGELWTRGADVDWTPAFTGRGPRTVDLPTYAFQRRRHWIDATPATPAHPLTAPAAPAPQPTAPAAPTPAGHGDSLRLVRENAAVVLGHTDADAIDPARSFKDLGFDSVTAVELCDRITRTAGLRLAPTAVYEHPTPARLARHLDATRDGTTTDAPVPVARAVDGEPIAIVSMGCRYPGGVRSPEDLWRVVRDEADVISEFPADRGWDLDALYDPDPDRSGTSYVREGGFLHDAAEFDAAFFGISPREALAMDPQQRLLLETTWEAAERAGIDPHRLHATATGVFIGATAPEYGPRLHEAAEAVEGHVLTGTTASVASGRIAYTLGLEGPAVTVDTACSSSLVALHMAVQSLRSGECSLAFAGGATVMGSPGMFVEFSRQRGLAVDGRCKPFAEGADGTGWAEGVGVLLLERLSDARRNGHEVLAVVRGSAINQDGASNGLTAPNGLSQQRVIRAALANAGLSAVEVDAVEAHGTGTKLGDPIEAQALLATYGQDRPDGRPLWLGSVKSNIGHSQAASGVAGVIKMVQAMRHGVLPKSLHADEVSSFVDWSAGAVEVLSQARPWEDDRPRRAGISSFGVSGTNAHVILEQPEAGQPEPTTDQPAPGADDLVVPLLVSARSEQAVEEQAERLLSHLRDTDASPADVAWTLFKHRSVFENRALLLGSDLVTSGTATSADTTSPVFVFPGQGAQWAGMAVELLDSSPVFAARFGECAAALDAFVDWSLVDVARGVEGAPGLDRVDVVQPVLWAVMVSLAALWESFGVRPAAVVGHSQGEIAAAVVAGALTLQDGARVVALRSRAITALAGRGGMVSVALPVGGVEELIAGWGGRVSIAAVNGPTSVVVSGDADALDELVEQATARDVRVRRIEVDYASHSAHVELIREELLEVLAPVVPREPEVPFFSTVTGAWLESAVTDGEYWYTNLRRTVQLEPAVRELVASGHGAFLEMSPHPVLTVPVAETVEAAGSEAVVSGTLRRGQGSLARFYTSLGEAWVRGVAVDWAPVFAGQQPRRVELPTYAFQRQRFWLELPKASAGVDPLDEAFWKTVEDGDLEEFARTLGLDGDSESLGAVVPALSSWRKGRRERSTLDNWRYRIAWRPLPTPAPAGTPADGTWLLVVPEAFDDAPLFRAVLGALTERMAGVSVLTVGTADCERQRLTERLRAEAEDRTFSGVLSLAGLDEVPHPDHVSVPRGLAVSLTLVQALGEADIQAPLWCLTRGAVAAADDQAPAAPVQAGVWGLGRVAALEHPKRWGGLIDLPETADAPALDLLVHLLTGEGTEDQIAVRAGKALGRRLVRAPHGRTPAARSWKPRGTVLVTGGTGALGVRMARWLAGQGADHLVLTGRRGADAPGTDDLRRALEDQGTTVSIAACDMADADSVAALMRQLEQDGVPPVRTVVHAAGISALGSLADAGITDLVSTLSGKVLGADHLADALDPAALDAVVYFSSISGTWGVADHGAYAAANAILDARAEQRRADGVPVLSVAWGPWAGGGMIAESIQDVLRRRGVPVIDPDTAVTGLQQALDHDETLVAIADVDWRRFAGVFTSVRRSDLLAELPEAQPADDDSRTSETEPALLQHLAQLDPARRRTALLDLVSRQVATVLGHDSAEHIDTEVAFKDLGFDSLTAVELRNRLGRTTGLRLPTTVVFDHPSITALADLIEQQAFGSRQDTADAPVPVAGAVDGEPIAIVSMGCRYPGGVRSPEDLWRVVRDEADVISEFPVDRGWDLDALYDPDPDHSGTSYVRESGFLQDAAEFDAAFFGISPREALAMDPQQRLLLETTWEALERAGVDPRALRGSSTGVYLGLTDQEYAAQLRAAGGEAEGYLATGAAASVASGRVAYTLGLEGPAVTVDTACSSSLVALHMAVQSLRSGECSLALAGAVTVMSGPGPFIAFSRQQALSRDGRCKPFSAEADGFALSEGVGVLLLERLSDARRNGHEVLAVVRGSAINQDGASNGLTAPNGPSQQRVIQAALSNAGLTAQDVDVVEAHGTGTKLGDPIEAQALLATYGQDRPDGRPLWLGSVKSNIGHSQAASGVAGVIKMVQAMRHGVLPKSLHADEVSSFVDWSAGAVEVLSQARPWEDDRPRRAGVSSFGISGTNAHVILEQPAPESTEPAGTDRTDLPDLAGVSVPLLVSARSEAALNDQAERLLSHLRDTDASPADVAWTLFKHRSVFENRALLLGSDLVTSGTATSTSSPSPVFVFPGQGAQWAGMAVELLDSSTVFAARFGECAAALDAFVDWSLVDVARGVEGAPGLDRVDVVQPVLWAVMVSLAALWESFGVRPAAVVGHSQGEIAAAVVAGALTLQDGARVVALRSRAITALAGRGGMVSVALSRAQVEEFIAGWGGRVSVAAVNGPTSVVVSGDADALDELVEQATARDVRVRRIEVDYASHSAHVELIREELLEVLAPVVPREPEVPFFSTVTGAWLESAVTDGEYWYTNLRRTVQLEPAVRELVASGHGAFLEMSPHPVLTVPVAETVEAAGSEAVVSGTLRRGQGSLARFYTSLGEAWVRGVAVDWAPVFDGLQPRRVELPTYAFQRQRFWLELPKASAASADPVDEAFWKTVEDGDLEEFARTLGLDGDQESLGAVVPALSSWRRSRRERSTLDNWRYRITWRPKPEQDTTATLDGTWLVVVPATHQDDTVVRAARGALHAAGARTVELSVPDSAQRGELAGRLLADLPADVTPAGVLSLLALDNTASERSPGVSRGLLGSMALAQALDDAGIPGRLWCLTRGAVSTGDGDGAPDPAQAAVWGLARVIGLDDPDRWGGLVDLPAEDTESAVHRLPALLAAEARGDEGRESEFALRGAGGSVRRMVRTPLPTSAGDGEAWHPHGTVLVTGGTGALGSHVARCLAQDGAEHLILTSRRGPEAPGATALRDELTALGCQVTLAACDIADRDALAALLDQIPDGLPLTAVVHTAGAVEAARPLGDLTPDDAAAVMHAKVLGAQNLAELLSGHPLDAFVLFSSGAGVWGNGGQAPYAAANAHLDALAEQRRARGLPATSIAWGAWAGGGMVDEEVGEQLLRRGVPAMAPGLAVRALRGAVTGRETTLVVADIRWDRFLPAYCAHGHRPLIDEVPEVRELLAARSAARPDTRDDGADAAAALLAELAALPEAKRRRRLVDLIRTHVGAVLGHGPSDTVKPGRAFRDMGFDSLTAVELRNRLSTVFGTRLSATIVFDHPTPNALADHLDAELLPAVGKAAGDTPAGLEQLEDAYRKAPDRAARQALTETLRTLLDTWAASEEPEEAPVDEELLAASDEDMFDLIDRELGIS